MGRFIKFCFVGASGVVVDMAILFLLADRNMFALPIIPCKIIATETAIINNFFWNDFWTFADVSRQNSKAKARLVRFAKFNLFCLIGMLLNVTLLTFQVKRLGFNLYFANLVAIGLVTVWNFAMNAKFGWRTKQLESNMTD